MNIITESTELSVDWDDIAPYDYYDNESDDDDTDNNEESGDEEQEQENGEGKEGNEDEDGEDDDNDGKDKDGKKPGKEKGKSSGQLDISQEDIDRMNKTHAEVEEALSQRGNFKSIDDVPDSYKNKNQEVNNRTGNVSVEFKIMASTKWKDLIAKMVSRTTPYDIEETRTKLPKNAISNVVAAVDQGTSVLNPAQIPTTQDQRKLIFVVDSSGSMDSYIPTIHSHIVTLITKQAQGVDDIFYLVKFSDVSECYACSIKRKNYVKVGLEELYNNKTTNISSGGKNTLDLFKRTISGGTILGGNLTDALIKAGKAQNCIIMVSDSDILSGDNLNNMKMLASHNMKAQTMGIILPSKTEFKTFTDIFGSALLSFVSHMGF